MTDLQPDITTRRVVKPKPKNVAPDEFHSGLVGMGAARAALAPLIKTDRHKAYRIYRAVGESGLRGAPALGWLAGLLAWAAKARDYPTPPAALKPGEATIVEERRDRIVAELGLDAPPVIGRPIATTDTPRAKRPVRGRGEFDEFA